MDLAGQACGIDSEDAWEGRGALALPQGSAVGLL